MASPKKNGGVTYSWLLEANSCGITKANVAVLHCKMLQKFNHCACISVFFLTQQIFSNHTISRKWHFRATSSSFFKEPYSHREFGLHLYHRLTGNFFLPENFTFRYVYDYKPEDVLTLEAKKGEKATRWYLYDSVTFRISIGSLQFIIKFTNTSKLSSSYF